MTELEVRNILAAALISLAVNISFGWIFYQIVRTIPSIRPPRPLEFSLVAPAKPSLARPAPAPKLSVSHVRPASKPAPPALPPVAEPPKASQEIQESPKPSELPAPPEVVSPGIPNEAVPDAELGPTPEMTEPPTETAPIYNADYLRNPAPEYPAAARKLGLQGTVIVRVLVNPDGRAETVLLEQSSGTRILDDAALRAIEGWLFVPARKGDQPVSAWVDVPIRFRLN